MQFEDLRLIEPLLRAVRFEGYTHPTPIQELAIPHVLAGKDLLGCAQTGTGKTAGFALPILHRLADGPVSKNGHRNIRVLILSPTRELAAQIGESFLAYGRYLDLRTAVIFGGVRQASQVKALRRGVDVLVATPGRLLDLMGQGIIRLDAIETFVLDEADRMLDMGFIVDIRKILGILPGKRQTLMFSATMPPGIRSLAASILTQPEEVSVTPHAPAAETVHQSVYFVEKGDKQRLLEHVLGDPQITRALVFTRTKRGADRVCKWLMRSNVQAEAIHSDRSQQARQRALSNFKQGRTRVLVASDIASRGLDVDDISHVINYDMPNEPETYVHRIGRTGRAGAAGLAISFCGMDERMHLMEIEKLIRRSLEPVLDHPFPSPLPPPCKREEKTAVVAGGWKKPLKRNLLRRRGRR